MSTLLKLKKINLKYQTGKDSINVLRNIDLNIEISTGNKNFTTYTMDLTTQYIKINADYRS